MKPDLLLHYTIKPNIYGGIAAGMLNIPSIAFVTGIGYSMIRKGILNRIVRTMYRYSLKYHDRVVFENSEDLEYFSKLGLIKNNGLFVNGCGVDTDHYQSKGSKDTGSTLFSFIGRILYDKGIAEFVQAAKLLHNTYPDVKFRIVGNTDPGNPASVPQAVLNNWMAATYIDHLPFTDDIRPQMEIADCIVLPSYREGLSRVLLEAMSMSKPIITTIAPGCGELVKEERNGFSVAVASVPELAAAIERMILLNPIDRNALGIEGRKIVLKEYSSELVTADLFDIIQKLFNKTDQE